MAARRSLGGYQHVDGWVRRPGLHGIRDPLLIVIAHQLLRARKRAREVAAARALILKVRAGGTSLRRIAAMISAVGFPISQRRRRLLLRQEDERSAAIIGVLLAAAGATLTGIWPGEGARVGTATRGPSNEDRSSCWTGSLQR